MEYKKQNVFLDVNLIRYNDQIISKWYRKSINNGRLLDNWLAHANYTKRNCLKSFARK